MTQDSLWKIPESPLSSPMSNFFKYKEVTHRRTQGRFWDFPMSNFFKYKGKLSMRKNGPKDLANSSRNAWILLKFLFKMKKLGNLLFAPRLKLKVLERIWTGFCFSFRLKSTMQTNFGNKTLEEWKPAWPIYISSFSRLLNLSFLMMKWLFSNAKLPKSCV